MEWGVWGLLRGHQKQYSLLFFLLLVCSKMPMGIIPILQGFFSESQGLNLGFGYWGNAIYSKIWVHKTIFFPLFFHVFYVIKHEKHPSPAHLGMMNRNSWCWYESWYGSRTLVNLWQTNNWKRHQDNLIWSKRVLTVKFVWFGVAVGLV